MESGVEGKAYNVIKSMYTNKYDAENTHFFPQCRGVRQGCSLSPTLFNIHIYIYIYPHTQWGELHC
jgi:hypothetical protein